MAIEKKACCEQAKHASSVAGGKCEHRGTAALNNGAGVEVHLGS